ncbi:MAG: efflux RND transporter periplasmic adaptor subunit [Rhodovibrionaceae bacterium]
MSLFKQLAILAVIAALAAAAWYTDGFGLLGESPRSAQSAVSQQPQSPPPVIVAPIRLESDAAVVEAVGTGAAVQGVTIYPETAGEVAEVLFSAGERVERDTPLLRLDDEDELLAVDLSKVRLQEARQQLRRYEQAAPSGAVSASELDTARTEVEAVKIELSRAELALRKRTVRAPFSGILGIPDVDAGDRVTESTAIATLDDRSFLLVNFEVPESFAYGIDLGQEVAATTWARPGESFTGTIDSTAARIDPATRTLRVRARIPNPQDSLRGGMSFVIRVPIGGERLHSVPSVSVQWQREGAYVWRITPESTAERVPIEVRKRSESWVLIEGDVAEGDRIVVEGVQRMRPGVAVEVREADTLPVASQGQVDGG